MAVAALVSGAWAADLTYQFSLGLNNISAGGSGGTTDSTLYFINTNTKEIYAYFSRSNLAPQTQGQTEGVWQSATAIENGSTTIRYNNETYTGGDRTLTSASITKTLHADDRTLANTVYAMTFTGTGLAYENNDYVDGLAALLYFEGSDKPLVYDASTLSDPFWSRVTGTQVHYMADYTKVVPEPTSGMLLLLGMAGLALRRRKAV